MIVKEYIRQFEKYGLGIFVHFGLYSILGKGEWIKKLGRISESDYDSLIGKFRPGTDWAKRIVSAAKRAGARYITLTARHHEGFSLYDTRGLSDFDSLHSPCGRDLVREFVDACRDGGIVPFFYHTLLDWHAPSYRNDFCKYLSYLRESIELLCKKKKKIGGFWFDGIWDKPEADWEEDALYGLIRRYQPEAMIINNTGLKARGVLGHTELDSVTFERGRPLSLNMEGVPKYVASEMSQTMYEHWGYCRRDFNCKSPASLIEEYCACRRYGANFLLNVGLLPNGYLKVLDREMLLHLGRWMKINGAPVRNAFPCEYTAERADDFILADEKKYYLFCHKLPMQIEENVVLTSSETEYTERLQFGGKIKSIRWLDNGKTLPFEQKGDAVTVGGLFNRYGESYVVRIAEISAE